MKIDDNLPEREAEDDMNNNEKIEEEKASENRIIHDNPTWIRRDLNNAKYSGLKERSDSNEPIRLEEKKGMDLIPERISKFAPKPGESCLNFESIIFDNKVPIGSFKEFLLW